MKSVFLTPIVVVLLAGAVGCDRQRAYIGERPCPHDQHNEDVMYAAKIKRFPATEYGKDTDYRRAITEADLLSLHMCQGSHKIFASEPPSARTEGLVDAQGATECVVELQSALHEMPTTHSAYSDINSELVWWNNKLLELDPTDYRRLNP